MRRWLCRSRGACVRGRSAAACTRAQVYACLVQGCDQMHCSAAQRMQHLVDHHRWQRPAALACQKGSLSRGATSDRQRGKRIDLGRADDLGERLADMHIASDVS